MDRHRRNVSYCTYVILKNFFFLTEPQMYRPFKLPRRSGREGPISRISTHNVQNTTHTNTHLRLLTNTQTCVYVCTRRAYYIVKVVVGTRRRTMETALTHGRDFTFDFSTGINLGSGGGGDRLAYNREEYTTEVVPVRCVINIMYVYVYTCTWYIHILYRHELLLSRYNSCRYKCIITYVVYI